MTATETIDQLDGKTLEGILATSLELLEDTSFPSVRKWRESGGKVIGHFQVYFPEEIAHAAGALPFKVRGAPIDAMQAESRFGSYLCSILKTSLELALSDTVELDMFVTPPICDAARNLAAVWGRNFPYPCQILYLPQNANSAYSAQYLRDEYERIKGDIEEITGTAVHEDDLRESIQLFNVNRGLIRELYEIKRAQPWLLPIEEAYVLMAIGGIIPREQHNELLELALPQIRERQTKQHDKIRVVFEGGFCEQPPLDFLRVISRSCFVVDDDLLIGLRWITDDVPTEGDPLMNLAVAYLESSTYSPVQHDLRKPKEKMLMQRIRESGAEAAIVTAAKMCEPGLDEQVAYAKVLDESGVPYFLNEFEEKMTSFDQIQVQLETFTENILFF
ncbi:MAG: 2-hydroxyacyl-CoA dehydratase family protein [Anaerolineae bacterium]|nr:MAG: 2-hydroxyacyl-CoA dehydratase family protein [Anaerolineae bacterium]